MLYTQATHRPRRRIAEETSEYADLLSERERLLRRIEIIDFWLRVKKTATCWIWTAGCTKAGYGQAIIGGKHYVTHRFAYELLVGPIPEGLLLRHTCDNPRCCNPDHLIPGTDQDNAQDKSERGRFSSRVRRLTPAEIEEMRARYSAGEGTQIELARIYGVGQKTAEEYLRGYRQRGRTFSEEEIAAIRARYAIGGISVEALANEHGVPSHRMRELLRSVRPEKKRRRYRRW